MGAKAKRSALGNLGLDALLKHHDHEGTEGESSHEIRDLPVDALTPGSHQPRRHFDEDGLKSLSDSIRRQGIIQPIVVRPTKPGHFEIVAGERRWRAARLAGLTNIPAIIRSMVQQTAMTTALIENIQRADLNPMEQADALRRLIDECGLTHERAAEAVGHSRAAVSNLLRLRDLDEHVRGLVREGRLSLGHAKVLMGASPDRQSILANQVVTLDLSVRQTEALVRKTTTRVKQRSGKSLEFGSMEQEFRRRLGTNVRLVSRNDGGGRLVISFGDRNGLKRLLTRIKES